MSSDKIIQNQESQVQVKYGPEVENFYPFLESLRNDKKVLFITTSNRGEYVEKTYGEKAKSTLLAEHLGYLLKNKGVDVEIIDASKLKIYNCLGCVSEKKGNMCGNPKSKVKDKEKNPTGYLKCWASHDFKDDQLWKIAKSIYESDSVIFFSSVRWGTPNSIYQKLIERLDWIESQYTTYGTKNTDKGIKSGMVLLGQNWRVKESLEIQKEVHGFFGFDIKDDLYLGWQYTRDVQDESQSSYKNSAKVFSESTGVELEDPKIQEGLSVDSVKKVFDFETFVSQIIW
jgi:multimeric flavodoxin WrbA